MAAPRSDALVLFGVTGDLAHKMIFPALYGMVKRGALNVPVIGVAFPNWSMRAIAQADNRQHPDGRAESITNALFDTFFLCSAM